MAGKVRVLRLYHRILKIAQEWKAQDPSSTATERDYIRSEAQSLFKKNKEVGFFATNSSMLLLIASLIFTSKLSLLRALRKLNFKGGKHCIETTPTVCFTRSWE